MEPQDVYDVMQVCIPRVALIEDSHNWSKIALCVCFFNVACRHSPMLFFEDLSLGKLFSLGGRSALMTGPWLAFGSRLVEFL